MTARREPPSRILEARTPSAPDWAWPHSQPVRRSPLRTLPVSSWPLRTLPARTARLRGTRTHSQQPHLSMLQWSGSALPHHSHCCTRPPPLLLRSRCCRKLPLGPAAAGPAQRSWSLNLLWCCPSPREHAEVWRTATLPARRLDTALTTRCSQSSAFPGCGLRKAYPATSKVRHGDSRMLSSSCTPAASAPLTAGAPVNMYQFVRS